MPAWHNKRSTGVRKLQDLKLRNRESERAIQKRLFGAVAWRRSAAMSVVAYLLTITVWQFIQILIANHTRTQFALSHDLITCTRQLYFVSRWSFLVCLALFVRERSNWLHVRNLALVIILSPVKRSFIWKTLLRFSSQILFLHILSVAALFIRFIFRKMGLSFLTCKPAMIGCVKKGLLPQASWSYSSRFIQETLCVSGVTVLHHKWVPYGKVNACRSIVFGHCGRLIRTNATNYSGSTETGSQGSKKFIHSN